MNANELAQEFEEYLKSIEELNRCRIHNGS